MRTTSSPIVLFLTASAAVGQLPCFDPNLGTQLALTDDSFSAIEPLGFTFHYGGVAYTDVQICSNGYLVLGTGPSGSPDYTPSVNELLGNPQPRICPIWRDLNPAAGGSGKVWCNAVPASGGNPAYFSVTWDGVFQYGTATPITCQILLADGDLIHVHHGEDVVNGANTWLLGASPGNGAATNPVQFSSLPTPIVTSGPTLHETGASGFAIAGGSYVWAPAGPGHIVVPASGCASWSSYGEGCVRRYGSFYEYFDLPGTPNDLSGVSFTMINAGNGYVTVQAPIQRRGIASATNLNMGDDQEIPVQFLAGTTTMPVPGGAVSGLTVCSNGMVSTGPNTTSWNPSVASFLGFASTAWAVGWHDLNPAAAGSGGVYVDETATHFYVIYEAVQSFGSTGAGNTMELHFDKTAGNVDIVIVSIDNTGNDYLVGFSAGGANLDPGPTDLSALTVATTGSPEVVPLALAADAPPIVNSGMSLVTSNITPTAVFGGLLFGSTRHDPGISLAAFGMPDCFQYNEQVAVRLFFPSGSSTVAVPITVPNAVGFAIQVQAAVYDPAAALTPVGAVASNGVELMLGN